MGSLLADPWFGLGRFDAANLTASARWRARIARPIEPDVFHPFMYAMIAIVGLKLIRDGAFGIWA